MRLTWTKLWKEYSDKMIEMNRCVMSYSWWTKYVKVEYPGIRLTRTAEDVCDVCVRIDVQLDRDDLPSEEQKQLLLEKTMHLSAAIDQRRAMSTFVKQYIVAHASKQAIPTTIISETFEETPANNRAIKHEGVLVIEIQIEDFGGSFAILHYGHQRLSADYFNSNLMMQNFIIANITNGAKNVLIYDERGQGKGADALCSLRLMYHIRLCRFHRQRGSIPPKISLLILDNYVDQNKSKLMFMFYALLSLLFYDKVVIHYLIPGHSHNSADRVVACCQNTMRSVNLYNPDAIVSLLNDIKSVSAKFLDHRSTTRPFFGEWRPLLTKYLKPMPTNYTSHYYFEIEKGVVEMRHLATTPNDESMHFPMILPTNIDAICRAILFDLFGPDVKSIHDIKSIDYHQLSWLEVKSLTEKKLVSLSQKYFSISPEFLSYYPAIPAEVANVADTTGGDSGDLLAAPATRSKKAKIKAVGVEKPKIRLRRPPKIPAILPGQTTVLSYFDKLKKSSLMLQYHKGTNTVHWARFEVNQTIIDGIIELLRGPDVFGDACRRQ